MPDPERPIGERVTALIEEIEESATAIHELGTPHPVVAGPLAELIALGHAAVPSILDRLEAQSPRVQAHLVLALSEIGDRTALEPLRALLSRSGAGDRADMWQRSLLSECREAVRRLEKPGGGEGGPKS